jgi:ubiquinone/menaquinone biosynthesis C-methylase UbiE
MRESRKANWETFWEEKKDASDVYWNNNRVLRNLRHVIDIRGKKILEIGAGTGRDSFPLIENGADVYQLDYAENSLKILRQIAEQRNLHPHIVGGDAFALPFEENTFDVVFHQGLLEHFSRARAEKLLRENIRVLKPGGLLLVDVPQRYHLYTIVKHILIAANKWFAGWERSFSLLELRRLMNSMDMTIVRTYGEWMYPSFFYRTLREMSKIVGVQLPLYPHISESLSKQREHVRHRLWETSLPQFTGISIGVIAQK